MASAVGSLSGFNANFGPNEQTPKAHNLLKGETDMLNEDSSKLSDS